MSVLHIYHVYNLKKLHAHTLSHTILACALLAVNTHDTQDELTLDLLCLICYTTHVVYSYNNYSYSTTLIQCCTRMLE